MQDTALEKLPDNYFSDALFFLLRGYEVVSFVGEDAVEAAQRFVRIVELLEPGQPITTKHQPPQSKTRPYEPFALQGLVVKNGETYDGLVAQVQAAREKTPHRLLVVADPDGKLTYSGNGQENHVYTFDLNNI
jgi:hypothetical protein